MDILLVDDDDDIRYLVTRMLTKHGHSVRTAENGEAALSELEANGAPDLVIIDQNMPKWTGTQTVGTLRLRWPDLPVLISSGYPDIDDWNNIRSPRTELLPKPFCMDDLLERLRCILGPESASP